jgi:hypothetical protein
VADAPVDALLARADELAKRWAIAMIAARPLADISDVPLEDLAREAPGLCAQFVLALDSDAELRRLVARKEVRDRERATPAGRLAALARAPDASACAEQVEALRGVLWEATLGELRDPPARLVADLSDRLALVCATALAAALEERPVAQAEEVPSVPHAGAREQVLYRAPQAAGRSGAVLVDEREDRAPRESPAGRRGPGIERGAVPSTEVFAADRPSTPPEPVPAQPAPHPPRTTGRPLPWDTPPTNQDAPGSRGGGDPVVRVTRRPVSPIDERP